MLRSDVRIPVSHTGDTRDGAKKSSLRWREGREGDGANSQCCSY